VAVLSEQDYINTRVVKTEAKLSTAVPNKATYHLWMKLFLISLTASPSGLTALGFEAYRVSRWCLLPVRYATLSSPNYYSGEHNSLVHVTNIEEDDDKEVLLLAEIIHRKTHDNVFVIWNFCCKHTKAKKYLHYSLGLYKWTFPFDFIEARTFLVDSIV
jgi:hypothetical protein